MSVDIILILLILFGAVVLFATEWLRMDVVALIVLCLLAVSGLVSPEQAISGFSQPAVVTIWAMFILSEGLTRAGLAEALGQVGLDDPVATDRPQRAPAPFLGAGEDDGGAGVEGKRH